MNGFDNALAIDKLWRSIKEAECIKFTPSFIANKHLMDDVFRWATYELTCKFKVTDKGSYIKLACAEAGGACKINHRVNHLAIRNVAQFFYKTQQQLAAVVYDNQVNEDVEYFYQLISNGNLPKNRKIKK